MQIIKNFSNAAKARARGNLKALSMYIRGEKKQFKNQKPKGLP